MTFQFAGLYTKGITYKSGPAAPGVAVTIKPHGSGSLATIYTDRTKATTTSNPVATDSNGNLSFFADPGQYDFTALGGSFTDQVPPDPLEYPTPGVSSVDALTGNVLVPAITGGEVAESGTWTATPNKRHLIDATASTTGTILAATVDKTTYEFKVTAGGVTGTDGALTNPVTVNLTGQHLNTTGGPTSVTLATLNQLVRLEYDAGTGLFTVVNDSMALSQLDARYVRGSIANGTYVQPDVIAQAATGVAATDTANLAAAIAACPVNGWLHIRKGRYYLNAALVIPQSMKVTGAGVFQVTGSAATGIADLPFATPWLYGTVLVQQTAATNAITITGAGNRVDLSDFGIVFDTAIQFANTGHGIEYTPPAYASYFDNGLSVAQWNNIIVFGHDGNHYAYKLVNPMHCTLRTIRSIGGGILWVQANSSAIQYGNLVVEHPFGVLCSAGTADAYRMEAAGAGGTILNLMHFIRPQVNAENVTGNSHFSGSTQPTSSQALWRDVGTVHDVTLDNPDLENDNSGVTHPTTFGTGTYVRDGYLSKSWHRANKPYNLASPGTAHPTVATGAALGSGASASITNTANGSTDLAPLVSVTTGSSPGSANTNVCTVTFATSMAIVPAGVNLTPTYSPPPTTGQFWVVYFDANQVIIQCSGVLAANTTYQFFLNVVQ
ncbi:MAG TPA: hypothetical protein VGL75_07340 [Acidothermaceae bacterium]